MGVVRGWWIYCLPHVEVSLTPLVSVLFGSHIPTFGKIFVTLHAAT